jgi:glucose/arabinose dehydrogenase
MSTLGIKPSSRALAAAVLLVVACGGDTSRRASDTSQVALTHDASALADAGAKSDAATPADGDAGARTDAAQVDSGEPWIRSWPAQCGAPKTSPVKARACPAGPPPALELAAVATGLSSIVFVTQAPGDPERLFIVEQTGRIRVAQQRVVRGKPFLDLTSKVLVGDGGELGLLGMAFAPDYEVSGRFWVNYTAPDVMAGAKTVVESYRVSSDPEVADPSTRTPLLSFGQPEDNHNGGMLAFGPDGCLYVGTGDGGGAYDQHSSSECPSGNGQCLDTELGKILRIDVDNPGVGAPGNLTGGSLPHIWDYGLRNPWRFSFDRATGDLYIADVGQDLWEEINIEPRGQGHHNYGWRVAEGNHCTPDLDDGGTCDPVNFTAAAHDYPHDNQNSCVIGGYVYRGSRIPSLNGYYVFGDYSSRRIWAIAWNGSEVCAGPFDLTDQLALEGWGPTSFGEGLDGELYVMDGSTVYRIDPK